jgi:hypothetical protein
MIVVMVVMVVMVLMAMSLLVTLCADDATGSRSSCVACYDSVRVYFPLDVSWNVNHIFLIPSFLPTKMSFFHSFLPSFFPFFLHPFLLA